MKTFITIWVAKDRTGTHVFWLKPSKIYDDKNDTEGEWCSQLHPLGDIPAVEDLVKDLTKNWGINHDPKKITIELKIV